MIPFSDSAYDRLAERRRDEEWLERAWESAEVLVVAGTRLAPPLAWVSSADAPSGVRVLLGGHGDIVRFAVIADAALAREGEWTTLRGVVPVLDAADAAYVVHAIGIAEWLWAARHCPRCGGRLVVEASGHEQRCVDCRRPQFPRSDPAVIMRVVDADDRILLGRQAAWPVGRWSTLAGFVEPGESLEAAVRREVFEEVGVRIGEVEYVGSQPWPLPASLMLGFSATAITTDIEVDGAEIEAARWFSRTEAASAAASGDLVIPPGVSISRTLITDWYGEDLPGSWS